jgi:hypothetical protein
MRRLETVVVAATLFFLSIVGAGAWTHGGGYAGITYYIAPSGSGGSDSNNGLSAGAPNGTGYATVTAMMATTIADFVPQASGAVGLGYQAPGACAPDAYYPTWLKGLVPTGVAQKPCNM